MRIGCIGVSWWFQKKEVPKVKTAQKTGSFKRTLWHLKMSEVLNLSDIQAATRDFHEE
jgi:hypothetical protein